MNKIHLSLGESFPPRHSDRRIREERRNLFYLQRRGDPSARGLGRDDTFGKEFEAERVIVPRGRKEWGTVVFQYILLFVVLYITAVTLGGNEPIILSSINLVFHEAGHPIFGLFGEVIGFLGGTLMQILIPLICAVSFFVKRDWFSVSFTAWWFGENMIGIAKYISDARARELPLLGGGTDGHDWNFLLGHFGLLPWDTTIGSGVLLLGVLIMSVSIAGMEYFVNEELRMRNEK